MTTSEQVVKRLTEMGVEVHPEAKVSRLYAGHWQKAAGAWSWSLWPQIDGRGYGSQHAASVLLRCRNWSVEEPNNVSPDLSIDPCQRCYTEWMGSCR